MNRTTSYDFEEWRFGLPRRGNSISSTNDDSEVNSLLSSSNVPSLPSRSSTPPTSAREGSLLSLPEETVRLELNPSVTISFVRAGRLFKIPYTFISICKHPNGSLRSLSLGETGQRPSFVHTFQNTRIPVPHLEQPSLANETSFRVSFLEEQTVQTPQTVFNTQLSYTFDAWKDCIQFQELLFGAKLAFIAGIAEAKSKGRGEECISQNLRILRGRNDRQVVLFFANSQRKEKKSYVSIPVSCIDHIDAGKKPGRPVALHLLPNFETLAQMKVLYIQFLEDNDQKRFCQALAQGLRDR